MSTHYCNVHDRAAFVAGKAVKADLFTGRHLFVGLNCFEPGQTQTPHVHSGADKFYFLVSGKARMQVGDETRDATAGDLVWAPSEVPHGVVEALERTVMLVAIAPPPTRG
jgi:quercetin dioxygenase-like cupin family protein